MTLPALIAGLRAKTLTEPVVVAREVAARLPPFCQYRVRPDGVVQLRLWITPDSPREEGEPDGWWGAWLTLGGFDGEGEPGDDWCIAVSA